MCLVCVRCACVDVLVPRGECESVSSWVHLYVRVGLCVSVALWTLVCNGHGCVGAATFPDSGTHTVTVGKSEPPAHLLF